MPSLFEKILKSVNNGLSIEEALAKHGTNQEYLDELANSAGASAGQFLKSDGTNASWATFALTDLPISQWGGEYIKLSDVKVANTAGGTFTSGSWQTRTLNTEDSDTGGHCSLSSNQFTLDAGTYRIIASAPAYNVAAHKAKLYNVSDASDEIIGSPEYIAIANVMSTSLVRGQFTIASSKTFEIQHRCGSTQATNGFGVQSNFGVSEIYTVVELWKVK